MRWPIRDLLASRTTGFDLASAALLCSLMLLWGLTLGAALFPHAWMQRGHRTGSSIGWAFTQIVPFMYTQEHTWTNVPEGLPHADAPSECHNGRRQHGPTAALTGSPHRQTLHHCGLPTTVTLTSRWRSFEVQSSWRVELDQDVMVITAIP